MKPRLRAIAGHSRGILAGGLVALGATGAEARPDDSTREHLQDRQGERGQDLEQVLRKLEEEERARKKAREAELPTLAEREPETASATSEVTPARATDELSAGLVYAPGWRFKFAPGFRKATSSPGDLDMEARGLSLSFSHALPAFQNGEGSLGIGLTMLSGSNSEEWTPTAPYWEFDLDAFELGIFAHAGVQLASSGRLLLGRALLGIGGLLVRTEFDYQEAFFGGVRASGTTTDFLPALRGALEFGFNLGRGKPGTRPAIPGLRIRVEGILALLGAAIDDVAPYGEVGKFAPSSFGVAASASVTF